MFIKRLKKAEEGSVAVLVALSLTVLCGFTAFAVDFGMLASNKQSMQNAADSAALAAAKDLGEGRTADIAQTIKTYCKLNGYDPEDPNIQVDYTISGKTIAVNISETSSMGFSAVLTGSNTRSVQTASVAEAISIFGSCPFAMFAGQRIEEGGAGIIIGGNNIYINGNIHSNSDISMSHAVLGEGVMATAVRHTNPSSEGWSGNQIALDMPSYSNLENALNGSPQVVEFSGNVTKSAHHGFSELIAEAILQYHARNGADNNYRYKGLYIHITGNLTFHGNSSSAFDADFPIILMVDGDINLNGTPLNSNIDHPMCIMSKNGDITVNGQGACYTGILYAPNGDIVLNGNNAEFCGSIVAKNIRKNGGRITVSYIENTDRFLPTSKVHLIE